VQQRARGTRGGDAPVDRRQSAVPAVAAEFLAQQQWFVLGAADADERMWASVVYGPPGFVSVPDPLTVRVATRPTGGDPLANALTGSADVGGLGLEPETRRRMRVNGRAHPDGDGLLIEVDQVYSNCPKYIATRTVATALAPEPPRRHEGTRLDGAARSLLGQADTAFVATRAPEHGADVTHRGGNPGFLRVVDDTTIVWPDYRGNAMFNTLGNLQLDPSCGLTVVSPDDGTTLHLSGRGEVLWDLDDLAAFPDAQRVVALHVQATVRLDHAAPLRWRLEHPAQNPPLS